MIQQIVSDRQLKGFTTHEIADAELAVTVDSNLREQDYIGVKVDDYYNSLKLQGETPKSVDYIVSVDCQCNAYVLYVLELKNTKTASFTTSSIHEKFDTAINRFMQTEFSYIYANDRYNIKNVFLYVVSSAYKHAVETENYEKFKEIMRRMGKKDTLNQDRALTEKRYLFKGHYYCIHREFPPNPIIKRYT